MFRQRQSAVRLATAAGSGSTALSVLQWTPPTDLPTGTLWRPLTSDERSQIARRHSELLLEWRRHPMWTKSRCAQHFVDRVHGSFRDKFAAMRGEYEHCLISNGRSGKCAVDVQRFREVNEYLTHHHALEDEQMFPAITRRYPELKPVFNFLDGDHDHLHPLTQRVGSGDGEALVEFNQFLNDHLNREEMIVVPLALAGLLQEDELAGKFDPPTAARVGQN